VLPAAAFPHLAPAGYRTIPAQDVGGHREENAPAVGRPRDAQAITESGGARRNRSLCRKLALLDFPQVPEPSVTDCDLQCLSRSVSRIERGVFIPVSVFLLVPSTVIEPA